MTKIRYMDGLTDPLPPTCCCGRQLVGTVKGYVTYLLLANTAAGAAGAES